MSRFFSAAVLLAFVVLCTVTGFFRLDISTDVIRSLPTDDPLIASGLDVFEHHPIQDQIAVDIAIDCASDHVDPALLVRAAGILEKHMSDSGLFAQVGTSAYSGFMTGIMAHVAENLPLLFSAEELQREVAPKLTQEAIDHRVQEMQAQLASLDGVGQARFAASDPLSLRDTILAKLAPLAPSLDVQFFQGHLLSKDQRHLLVTARPVSRGTDTAAARSLAEFFEEATHDIQTQLGAQNHIVVTPVGAYRAALDNEDIIRHDVNIALLLAVVGIGILLLIVFPRPLLGLLSLLPAFAGMGLAICAYSFLHDSISIMVLGFGSAIISITVDHGITYLLFLDGPEKTSGKAVSREVRSIGLMTVVTSIGAFLLLSLCDFPLFKELGQFTALGIFFSYLLVHWGFPRIFPTLNPSTRKNLPLRSFIERLFHTGKWGALAAVAVMLLLLPFARPVFHVSLNSMNSVREATEQADALFAEVWGGTTQRVFYMEKAATLPELQQQNDKVLQQIERDLSKGLLAQTFVPSMIFPGRERMAANLQAWQGFWTPERRDAVVASLQAAAVAHGFTSDAFAPFITTLDGKWTPDDTPQIPQQYFELLGISQQDGRYIQHLSLNPGPKYDAHSILEQLQGNEGLGSLLDTDLFTMHLAELLFHTFLVLFVGIACCIAVLLFLFYLDLPLTLITLAPPAFSFICTLGTLHLLGRPLDIPSLMLSIVILGMGIDYSIFCVRAHQRYRDMSQPASYQAFDHAFVLVHLAVFLAGVSTMIGFGVLCLAEHSLLKSIGITSLLGIGYSLVGAFFLLPPLLTWYLNRRPAMPAGLPITKRVRARYRTLEAYPRMFARCKMGIDPIFADLGMMLDSYGNGHPETIVDIGCGYGVPGCWCLEKYPEARLYGLDPDPERVRVASFAFGDRGEAVTGFAPELPSIPSPSGLADIALLLDMLHYLDDACLDALLANCSKTLAPSGLLVMRVAIIPAGKRSWSWHLEDKRIRFSGYSAYYRTTEELAVFCERAGFTVLFNEISPENPELVWMVCRNE